MVARPAEETEPLTSTVDHVDIRGLGTTLLVSVGCLPRSRHEGVSQPHNVHEGCTITGAAPPPRVGVAPGSVRVTDSPSGGRLRRQGLGFGDRPHEGRELARDGGGDGFGVLAAREQLAIAPTEGDLRPPNIGGQVLTLTIGPLLFFVSADSLLP